MSGGTVVPRHECPGGHFFQGDSHASDTGMLKLDKRASHENTHKYFPGLKYDSANVGQVCFSLKYVINPFFGLGQRKTKINRRVSHLTLPYFRYLLTNIWLTTLCC